MEKKNLGIRNSLIMLMIALLGAFAIGEAANFRTANNNLIAYLPVMTQPEDIVVYYVSKNGNNADGKSWATAWNEMDQINWDEMNPGDTIFLDGGATSMTYRTSLNPQVSGTASEPILIQLSSEAGRNGQVILFGGNSVPLPECGQLTWDESELANAGQWGIQLQNGIKYIEIDGRKRSGIVVHGWKENGIRFFPDKIDNGRNDNPARITLRYIEVYNNGEFERKNDGSVANLYYPLHSRPGIILAGVGHTFDHLEIHDNAGDAIQSGFTNPTGGTFNNIDDLTITNSWLYNSRPHSGQDNSPPGEVCNVSDLSGCDELGAPQMARDYQFYPEFPNNRRESFNWCTHSDGIQLYSSNDFNNLTIQRSFIGPNFMNGLILGDNAGDTQTAWVNNLTLEDVVITRYMHNALGMNNKGGKSGSNWNLNHVTMYGHYNNIHKGSIQLDLRENTGGGHTIKNSYKIYGQSNFETDEITLENNCEYAMYKGSIGGNVVDPRFRRLSNGDLFTNDLSVDFATIFKDNYEPSDEACADVGSRVRTITDIFP